MSSTTTQLLSSGEFCKLRYEIIPVKIASANVSFYTNNSKMPNFELWHSCRKWAICVQASRCFYWERWWSIIYWFLKNVDIFATLQNRKGRRVGSTALLKRRKLFL